jgi:Zn ribbon nucleic-acid-binding protein
VTAATDQNQVEPGEACPKCGERDADRLVWIDDDTVQCGSCGTKYRPLDHQN